MGLFEDITSALFGGDSSRTAWLFVAALAALLALRWLYLFSRRPITAPPAPLSPLVPIASAAATAPYRSWWPSKKDRVAEAVELVRLETDALLAKVENVNATAGLAKARRELAALLRELEPPPALPATSPAAKPVLTADELSELLDLLPLEPHLRRRLDELIAARIEEKRA